MPTQLFLDEFFPDSPALEARFSEIKFASVPDLPDKEDEMYESLVSMTRSISHLISNRVNFSVLI